MTTSPLTADDRQRPVASVVIPCRDHARELARCLRTLVVQSCEGGFEIIVVDAAADPAVAAVVGCHPEVRIVRSPAALLPGAARNLGAENAKGRWLLFIDADCVAEPGWLPAAIAALAQGARLVGGSVRHGQPWHPVAVIDNLMQFSDLAPGRPGGAAPPLPSCNLAIARDDFLALGGFPDLPAGEDILFYNRAAGRWPGQTRFVPAMRVRHFGRATLRQLWRHQELFGFARGLYGLELKPVYRHLGRFALIAPAVGVKRLSYLVQRAGRWHPVSLVQMTLFLPILLYAMGAWCYGFRRGCRQWAGLRP